MRRLGALRVRGGTARRCAGLTGLASWLPWLARLTWLAPTKRRGCRLELLGRLLLGLERAVVGDDVVRQAEAL